MDELDHLEFLDFMNEQELKAQTIEANRDNEDFINQDRNLTKGTNRKLGDFYDNKI